MKRICSWCGTVLVQDREGDGQISHGICIPCSDHLLSDNGVSIQTIIDRFPFPVLLVDGDAKASVINKPGQEALHLLPGQVANRRCGELFSCTHSRLPAGCGKTIHCSECTLRRTVTYTFATGEPRFQVPATLKTGDAEVSLTISTFKMREAVLVKIDRL